MKGLLHGRHSNSDAVHLHSRHQPCLNRSLSLLPLMSSMFALTEAATAAMAKIVETLPRGLLPVLCRAH